MKTKGGAKYSEEQLLMAIEAVKKGSTQFAAARKYGIPRSTLFNKITGKTLIGKKSGPGTVLSVKEEKYIEKWVTCLADRGFPVVKRQFLRSIQLYLNSNNRKTPFANNYPGRKWYKNFLKRHPIIVKRLSQNLIKSRASVTEIQLKTWHAEVYKYCEDNNLLDALNDPTRIFNVDEKGFILTPKNEVVLARKGQKAVYNRSQNDEKECVTALLGGNAAGMQTPPMLVYPYKRMPSHILLHLPANWSVGISDNGWQTQQTFFDYIKNVFCKWLSDAQIKLPVILFIDGHKSHISLTLSEFCSANQIELVALYPNATHVIQPMDVVVFKPLGGSWDVKVKDWKIANQFAKIDKKDIAPILNEAINGIDYAGLLKKGFQRCGLFPFIADNINFSRLVPVSVDVTQDQFFDDENAIEPERIETEQEAVNRLKIVEELIEPSYLHLFRSSNEEWKGPIEYTALFSIWKKLYATAAAFQSADDEVMVIDVDTMDSTETHQNIGAEVYIVGENGELLKSDDVSCILIESEVTVDESVTFGECGLDEFETGGETGDVNEFIDESLDGTAVMSVDTLVADQKTKTVDVDESPFRIASQQEINTTEGANSADSRALTAGEDARLLKTIRVGDSQPFDKDSFQKSFPMPELNTTRKKKLVPKEKRSSVITSEAWKEVEKKKLEEKERLEGEKVVRKMEREKKKILAAQVKAEKELMKQQKIKEKAEKEAEKKLKKQSKKVTL